VGLFLLERKKEKTKFFLEEKIMNNETTILEVILTGLAMPAKPLFALAAFWIVCDLTRMAVRCVMEYRIDNACRGSV